MKKYELEMTGNRIDGIKIKEGWPIEDKFIKFSELTETQKQKVREFGEASMDKLRYDKYGNPRSSFRDFANIERSFEIKNHEELGFKKEIN